MELICAKLAKYFTVQNPGAFLPFFPLKQNAIIEIQIKLRA